MNLENAYLVDGVDLWSNFGITLAKGSLDDFLKLPKRKQSIEHNWGDEDGIDIDTSRNFYEPKEINVRCYIIADTEELFWTHYDQFLSLLKKPGLRRFTVTLFNRDYFVVYRECNLYDKLTPFRDTGKLFCSFGLHLTETNPGFNDTPTYLVNEDNLFIIT